MKLEEINNNGGRKKLFITFDSIRELSTYCNEAPVNEMFKGKQASVSGNYSFTQTHSFEIANDLLVNGWEKGSEMLTKALNIANIKPQTKEVKRSINDIVGFQVNVPNYLMGIPTNMVNKKTIARKQPIINLIKSCSYSGHITADEIMQDSVKFLQIIQAIEKKGFRVNAYTHRHGISGNEEYICRVKIKSANERINISKMAFPLIHSSFLRRIMFRVTELELRTNNRSLVGSYGIPANESQSKETLKSNEYLIPTLINEEQAKQIVAKSIKQ